MRTKYNRSRRFSKRWWNRRLASGYFKQCNGGIYKMLYLRTTRDGGNSLYVVITPSSSQCRWLRVDQESTVIPPQEPGGDWTIIEPTNHSL